MVDLAMDFDVRVNVAITFEEIPDEARIIKGENDRDNWILGDHEVEPSKEAPAPDLLVPAILEEGIPPPVLYCAYTRDVCEDGPVGSDARSVQRALWAWARVNRGVIPNLDDATVQMMKMPSKVKDRRTPGAHVDEKVAIFRESIGLGDGGYDHNAHRRLAPYFDQWGHFLLDTWHEAQDEEDAMELISHAPDEFDEMNPRISGASPNAPKAPAKPKKPLKVKIMTQRKAIAAAAMCGYRNRVQIHYTMGPSRMSGVKGKKKPPKFGYWEDCSSFSTWCCWVAGLPDPNGVKYNGTGYTGTMINHGRRISITSATIGDFAFHGSSSSRISHVVVIVSEGRAIVSHGQESGPAYYSSPYYRSDARFAHTYFRKAA